MSALAGPTRWTARDGRQAAAEIKESVLMAGGLERVARAAVSRRRHSRPRLRVGSDGTRAATVFFLVPDFAPASGGVRVMYRHVDILNQAGIAAAVLHQRRGFRIDWFANSTVVTNVRDTEVGPNDILVLPELDVDIVARLPHPVPHIVLNQSGHLTWRQQPAQVSEHYRSGKGLLGMITVSEHSTDLMTYALPGVRIERVRPSIDPSVFGLGGTNGTGSPVSTDSFAPRQRRLSYLARRGAQEAVQVIGVLSGRGVLDGWEVREIGGLPQAEFAVALRTGRIMLSLSYQEGFGLPAAEAMASGNYVVGYHGFGGQEFFRPEFSGAVPTGDLLAVARKVEEAIRQDAVTDRWCIDRGREASEYVLAEYSPQHEREDVLRAYNELIHPGRGPSQDSSPGPSQGPSIGQSKGPSIGPSQGQGEP